MQNALIFSPVFDGHRQVYVFVMTHILKELGFNVFIAGNTGKKISNSFYIDILRSNSSITFLDTGNYSHGGLDITLTEFLKLQETCKTDLTIFADADNHLALLTSQIFGTKRKLRGKVIGIFMRPFYYYRESRVLDKLRFLKHFFSRWNTDEELFYKFFLKRFSLLDISLCIDDNFTAKNRSFTWLPDVFQQYAEVIIKADAKSEQRQWIQKLNAFKEKNKERFAFFYFGTAQFRRGYDILLKLAEETGGCFIHCGLRDNNVEFAYDTTKITSRLKNEGRFFETNEYIEDPLCIEYFFRSVSHLILPYRKFFGSSGVMLQALEYGIPILAPSFGVMGYRIEKYNLGITYSDSDVSSLKAEVEKFIRIDPQTFQTDIRTYMKLQSVGELKSVLINSFVLTSKRFTGVLQQA